MPLSITKLQDFLSEKGFVANKYFTMDGYCFFIEIFCLKTADIFLLYIPSKYDIQLRSKQQNSYKIKYIDMTSSDNLADEYAGHPDHVKLENAYGNNDIHISPGKDHIEEHLENNYRHAISISDISKDDTTDLKAVYRQLKRLKYCVQNLKYKLGIIYKNYICVIRRDDAINCFTIKNYPRDEYKQLMIIIDLETFYEKEKLIDDIRIVRESIYRVLERNQSMHGKIIENIIENKKDISIIPKLAENKKTKYDEMILQLEEMITIMSEAEKKTLEELYNLTNMNEKQGLQNDINRVHNKAKLEKELDKINVIRGDISKNMFIIREKRDNVILNIDKIMFDNTVMFDCMVRNFAKLKELC